MTNFSTLFSPVSVTIANISELNVNYQTLTFDENNQNLSIANGNTVSLSSLAGSSGTGREDVNTLVIENSGNWNEAYNIATAYQSVSSSFATSTTVNNISGLLTPLTLTNSLTGQLVTNTAFANYQTSVAGATATLLPTSIYQNASGNWQSAYTNLVTNSAAYLSGVNLTFLQEPSANWNSTYTTVQNNSASWQEAYNISTAYQQASSTFLTSETDSQTLIFTESSVELSISNGNTVSLSGISGREDVNTLVIENSGNWFNTAWQFTSASSGYELSAYFPKTLVSTLCSTVLITLPVNPKRGEEYTFKDCFNTWNTNYFLLSSNYPIEGFTEILSANTQGGYFSVIFVDSDTGWSII